MSEWVVYILQCSDDSLYTGITNDLIARVATHNAGKGAKYTRGRRPVSLVYSEVAGNRSAASQREYQLKKLDRAQKQDLIATP